MVNVLQQAVLSHQFLHQSAQALQQQFKLSPGEAKSIPSSCPDCHITHVSEYYGTNPRGLSAFGEWQTDVTKMPEFRHFEYVHVTVDTFSCAMVASAFTGEKTQMLFYHAFSILGVPRHIKTDNGPA